MDLTKNIDVDQNVINTVEGILGHMVYDLHEMSLPGLPIISDMVLHHDGNLDFKQVRRWGSAAKRPYIVLPKTDLKGRDLDVRVNGTAAALLAGIFVAGEKDISTGHVRIGRPGAERPEDFGKRWALNAVIQKTFDAMMEDTTTAYYESLVDYWSYARTDWTTCEDNVIADLIPQQAMHHFETYLGTLNWQQGSSTELMNARESFTSWGSW